MTPGVKRIDPGCHRVDITARCRRRELGLPHIVAPRHHRDFMPLRSRFVAAQGTPLQDYAQHIVPIGKTMCRDLHAGTRITLDRKATPVDRRQHGIDHGTNATVRRQPRRQRPCNDRRLLRDSRRRFDARFCLRHGAHVRRSGWRAVARSGTPTANAHATARERLPPRPGCPNRHHETRSHRC